MTHWTISAALNCILSASIGAAIKSKPSVRVGECLLEYHALWRIIDAKKYLQYPIKASKL